MGKYIDREALIDRLEASPVFPHFGMDGFFLRDCVTDLIKKAPSVDAVDAVRCAECKHLRVINGKKLYAICAKTNLKFKPFDIDTRTHFCSYGERSEK